MSIAEIRRTTIIGISEPKPIAEFNFDESMEIPDEELEREMVRVNLPELSLPKGFDTPSSVKFLEVGRQTENAPSSLKQIKDTPRDIETGRYTRSDRGIVRKKPTYWRPFQEMTPSNSSSVSISTPSLFRRIQDDTHSRSTKKSEMYLTTETQLPLESSNFHERLEMFTKKQASSSSVMSQAPIRSVIQGYLGTKRSGTFSRLPERLNSKLDLVTRQSYQYFVDEETLEKNQAFLLDEYLHSKAEVNFSSEQYLQFLLWHLLYFLLLGPFINLILICKPRLRYLLFNMEFYRLNLIAVIQSIYWAISLYVVAGFIWHYSDAKPSNDVFDSPLLKTVVTSLILRTTSIAGKYATYPKMLIKQYNNQYLDKGAITKEFMLIGWLKHCRSIIREEIEHCVERLEMDPEAFKISFMSPISQSCEKALDTVVKDHEALAKKAATGTASNKAGDDQMQSDVHGTGEEVCSSIKPVYHEYQMSENKTIRYYSAEYIFEVLVQNFNKTVSVGRHMLTGWCLGIIWSFVPSLLRLKSGQNFHGTGPMAISATYLNGLLSAFLFFVQFMFYIQAIVDMRRKYYLMCQLGYMMSPKMIKMYPFDKYLPTVGILDRISLVSWYNLRRMALDYGRKYFYRHEIFLPVNLLLLSINIIGFFVVTYLGLIGMIESTTSSKILLSFAIDGVLYLVVSFHFMYDAGRLNEEFESHLRLVHNNKGLLAYLLQMKHYYFESLIGSHTRFGRDVSAAVPDGSLSFLHLHLRDEIVEELGPALADCTDREALLTDYLEEQIRDYESVGAEIQREMSFEQVTILGVAVTKNSVVNFFVGIVSLVFTVYQLIMPNGSNTRYSSNGQD